MSERHELTDPVEPEVDRKRLRLAARRFREINYARRLRVRDALPGHMRLVFDVLALLFHVNHPMLPGYISHQVPAGVSGYRPGKPEIEKAKKLARSFTYKRDNRTPEEIDGIYLMGSTGTIAHSSSSDMDFWICYADTLSTERLALLAQKTALLQKWIDELGADTHLFLMCGGKFRSGQREPLTGENCGSAQHYLLLDEFYRTGILLAGKYPVWWLVPPHQEHCFDGYASSLRRRRFIDDGESLDFGGIHKIPAGEFIGAGVWQLYKAIESPHKSVLKLLLTEVYAKESPDTKTLSGQYKAAVYRGVTDLDELDPYVMVYRKLEQHLLESDDQTRLDMVRRCLYYKVGKPLSRAPYRGVKSWQRVLMEKLCAEWRWNEARILELDQRTMWNINLISSERRTLVNELFSCYSFLSDFARQHATSALIRTDEFHILGNRLHAAFQRKSGKIDVINAGRMSKLTENEVSICRLESKSQEAHAPWGLFAESVTSQANPDTKPLRVSNSLVELLAWATLNSVIDLSTKLSVRETRDKLRYQEATGILHALERLATGGDSEGRARDGEAFGRPAETRHQLVLVNVATEPLTQLHLDGLQRISDRTDSLGYSGLRENLVLNLETVETNSWGETIARRYDGRHAMLRCVKDFVQNLSQGGPLPKTEVKCFSSGRSTAIATRLSQLFEDLVRCFRNDGLPANTRYILQIENNLHLIQVENGTCQERTAASIEELYQLLALAQRRWSPIVVDRFAAQDSLLPVVCPLMQSGQIQVFVENRIGTAQLVIIDEKGSFYRSEVLVDRENATLAAMHKFLSSIVTRQNSLMTHKGQPALGHIRSLNYYVLDQQRRNAPYRVQPIEVSSLNAGARFQSIQVIAEPGSHTEASFSVYCDDMEFHQQTLQEAFYTEVASHVFSLRKPGNAYPCYITDLDLSRLQSHKDMPLQTVHYFQYKSKIEAELNSAFRRLSGTSV